MSLPWKKVKKASISQLVKVKDHVHSQRNSGSPLLMVETGFPTSIVDLFVKNRERFKKPSKKNKHKSPNHPSMAPISQAPTPTPPPPSPATSPIHDLVQETLQECEKSDLCPCPQGSGDGEGVAMNRGLVAVFKMFLVVVLVLGMNSLVVGITLSAFLLFFLEYAGPRFHGLLMPFSSMVQRICNLFRAKIVTLDEEECVFKAPLQHQQLTEEDGCVYSVQEIEPCPEESQCSVDERNEFDCEGVVIEEKEDESSNCLLEFKEKKSKKEKMKLKVKKLVPKKFRKKKGSDLESRVIKNEADNVIEGKKIVGDSTKRKLTSDGFVASREIDCKRDVVEVVDSVGGSSEQLTNVSIGQSCKSIEKATIIEDDGFTKREHNSTYIFLVLAVLVGLIEGRLLALIFTLMCCLIARRGEGIRRYTKLPVIRPFAEMLC